MNGRCVGAGELLPVAQAHGCSPHPLAPQLTYRSVPSVGRGLAMDKG